jgi:peptidoglycan/LPS O-acetylase OafA/YrhL
LQTPLLIQENERPRGANHFDFIRLSMALLVVWSHSFALYLGTEANEPVSLIFNGLYNSGKIGVMAFFVISGFLITKSFVRSKSTWLFMQSRVRRIYPGYLVATTICAFIVIPLYSSNLSLTVFEVVETLGANLLLKNHFPPSNAFAANPTPNAVNGSLWSIPYEFWCYIGVAILGMLGLLLNRWLTLCALIATLAGRVALDVLGKKPGGGIIEHVIGWPYMWLVILPSFLLGMLAYTHRDFIPRSRILLAALVAGAIISSHLNEHLANMLVAPALAYTTFYIAFDSVKLPRASRWGDFSYGTYLYAYTIQQMLYASYGRNLNFAAYIILSLLTSLIAGVISWYLVERHFIRRKSYDSQIAVRAEKTCSTRQIIE